MPSKIRSLALAPILAVAIGGVAGCGSNGPAPSIPATDARTLQAKIAEIKANVDVGSCLVASDKTDDLIADIGALPSSVNRDVVQALNNGANQLKLLLADPTQCQGRTTSTTTPSTTQSTTTPSTTTTKTQPTTTTRTQTQSTTTPTQTQTQPSTTPGGSGGISPGGL